MTETEPSYITSRIEPSDAKVGFRSGSRLLDDYFARHALSNDREGIGRAYILRRAHDADPALPSVVGFYTLSMAIIDAEDASKTLGKKLPRYQSRWLSSVGSRSMNERADGEDVALPEPLSLGPLDPLPQAARYALFVMMSPQGSREISCSTGRPPLHVEVRTDPQTIEVSLVGVPPVALLSGGFDEHAGRRERVDGASGGGLARLEELHHGGDAHQGVAREQLEEANGGDRGGIVLQHARAICR